MSQSGKTSPTAKAVADVAPEKPEERVDGVFLRGSRWWVSYYGPGADGRMRQIREPALRLDGTPARTPKEAKAFRERRRQDVAMHRRGLHQFHGPRAERVLFTELLEDYQRDADVRKLASLPQIHSRVRRLTGYFSGYRALAITHAVLLKYIQYRQSERAADATINRELEVVSRAFGLALVAGKLAFGPKVPSLREDNARQGFFDYADFLRVLSHIDDADVRDFLEWFFHTGMRPKETCSLTWAACDKETWTLTLPGKDAKTRKPRTLPLRAELRAIVERRQKARRVEGPDGQSQLAELIFHRAGKRMGEFRKTWTTACRKAGLATTTERNGKTVYHAMRRPYDLRRTAVRNMVRAGADPAVAMKISGHRTRAVFDRYNIVDERDLADAIERTSEYVRTLPTEANVVVLDPAVYHRDAPGVVPRPVRGEPG